MSCIVIQTDSEEKPDINTSVGSSPPPVYTPAQPTESPQSPQQQQPVVQPQPYVYPGAGGQMIVVPPRPPLLPKELQPNDYLVITISVAIVCGIYSIGSLLFSIPALICSVKAFQKKNKGFYTTAKKLGVAAIILDLICITWVFVWAVLLVGMYTYGYVSLVIGFRRINHNAGYNQ